MHQESNRQLGEANWARFRLAPFRARGCRLAGPYRSSRQVCLQKLFRPVAPLKGGGRWGPNRSLTRLEPFVGGPSGCRCCQRLERRRRAAEAPVAFWLTGRPLPDDAPEAPQQPEQQALVQRLRQVQV